MSYSNYEDYNTKRKSSYSTVGTMHKYSYKQVDKTYKDFHGGRNCLAFRPTRSKMDLYYLSDRFSKKNSNGKT